MTLKPLHPHDNTSESLGFDSRRLHQDHADLDAANKAGAHLVPSRDACPRSDDHTPRPAGVEPRVWLRAISKTHKQVRCSGCGRFEIWIPAPARQPKIPISDAARLRLAIQLLERWAKWHHHVPDEPVNRTDYGTVCGLTKQTRALLKAAKAQP
jgi:hypothetical protein